MALSKKCLKNFNTKINNNNNNNNNNNVHYIL